MPKRTLIVSNRLPVTLTQREDDRWEAAPSSGGLVSALEPVLKRCGGVWIGWPGTTECPREAAEHALAAVANGYRCKPVMLSPEEVQGFYCGFSNEIIWPLFHDLFTSCNFDPEYWAIYRRVNRKFAAVVAQEYREGDYVWVHDYHLMGLARELQRLEVGARTGFFLHIPFPPLEMFLKLPWRFEILRSLLAFDALGFQTARDQHNFLACAQAMFDVRIEGSGPMMRLRLRDDVLETWCEPAVTPDALPKVGETRAPVVQLRGESRFGEGRTQNPPAVSPAHYGMVVPMPRNSFDDASFGRQARTVHVGAFPIGIDYEAIATMAARDDVRAKAAVLRADLSHTQIILGVDRLDYTKGLINKLEAFRNALRRYPDLHQKVTLVQHVVPSRSDIPEYRRLRQELEQRVGEINGEFTASGWVPVHYMYHSLELEGLVAYYLAADIALVTSLKDGMNLVAKEYCAAQIKENGVLILSEFAGAAAQLQCGALLINPHDIAGMADCIHQAVHMPFAERQRRMQRLRRVVRTEDVYCWANAFLGTVATHEAPRLGRREDFRPHVGH